MTRFVSVLREVWHLFVDDGVSAAAIVVWPAVVWLIQAEATLSAGRAASLLFVGLAFILLASAIIRSRSVSITLIESLKLLATTSVVPSAEMPRCRDAEMPRPLALGSNVKV